MTQTHSITRIPHAAHTGNGGGWDLEQIDIQSATRFGHNLPPGFEYHSGYRDHAGNQHWLFVRCAPLSPGRCERCPGGAAFAESMARLRDDSREAGLLMSELAGRDRG